MEYKNISKKTLQESIESEMSGNLEELLVAVGENDTDDVGWTVDPVESMTDVPFCSLSLENLNKSVVLT